jgi:hypothetical protein
MPATKREPANAFYLRQLHPLIGQRVKATITDADGEFFGLSFVDADGRETLLWLQNDDEGNGPGSFTMEEHTS